MAYQDKARRLDATVVDVLRRSRIDGDKIYLPEGQLDRKLYLAVNVAIEALGGKWSRKAEAHVFADDGAVDLADRLAAVVATGSVIVPGDFDFYPTPPELAARVVAAAQPQVGLRWLEPSAGRGALIEALWRVIEPAQAPVVAVELLEANVQTLADLYAAWGVKISQEGWTIVQGNFFDAAMQIRKRTALSGYDRVIMNPPFSKDAAPRHVQVALSLLKPNGRLVAIVPSSLLDRTSGAYKTLRRRLEDVKATGGSVEFEYLPVGAFREQGTGVSTGMLTVHLQPSHGPVRAA